MANKTHCDSCNDVIHHGIELKYKIKKWFFDYCDWGWTNVDLCFVCFKGLKSIGDGKHKLV